MVCVVWIGCKGEKDTEFDRVEDVFPFVWLLKSKPLLSTVGVARGLEAVGTLDNLGVRPRSSSFSSTRSGESPRLLLPRSGE